MDWHASPIKAQGIQAVWYDPVAIKTTLMLSIQILSQSGSSYTQVPCMLSIKFQCIKGFFPFQHIIIDGSSYLLSDDRKSLGFAIPAAKFLLHILSRIIISQ